MDLNEAIPYLVKHARSVTIRMGVDSEKTSVSTAKPGDSVFKGIGKARAARPLGHAEAGLFHVELASREYDTQRFTGPTLEDAIFKAVGWTREAVEKEERK